MRRAWRRVMWYWLGVMILTAFFIAFDCYYDLLWAAVPTSIVFGFALFGFIHCWMEVGLEKKRAEWAAQDEAFIGVMGDLGRHLRGQ